MSLLAPDGQHSHKVRAALLELHGHEGVAFNLSIVFYFPILHFISHVHLHCLAIHLGYCTLYFTSIFISNCRVQIVARQSDA